MNVVSALGQQPSPKAAAANATDKPQPVVLGFALGTAVEAQSVPEGERKMVTALFVDIIDSTELGQNLDPEEARAIIDPALGLMIDAVRRYDGYVVQSTGDGIFALFGAPVAREDHPQRSLYSAMRMQDEIRRYSARLRAEGRPPIQIRAGANSGEVVVRTIKTGAGHTEYTPIGHTVNLASRLQSLANAGSTVISDSTRTLVEGYFALRPLGQAQVKGISEPINVHEVVGLGPLRTRLQRSAGRGLSKFVGRTKEKEALRRAAARAQFGGRSDRCGCCRTWRWQVAARSLNSKPRCNPNGRSSKRSRSRTARDRPICRLSSSCMAILKSSAKTAFTRVARRSQPRSECSIRTWRTGSLICTLCLRLRMTRIVSLEWTRNCASRGLWTPSRGLLLAEAVDRPLLLIIEDLHWLDDESQALLDTLADMLSGSRMLLLVNYRPEYAHRWGDKAWCSRLRLESLGEGSADEMLSAILGDDPRARAAQGAYRHDHRRSPLLHGRDRSGAVR